MSIQDTIRARVRHNYGEALQSSADLCTDACCTPGSISAPSTACTGGTKAPVSYGLTA